MSPLLQSVARLTEYLPFDPNGKLNQTTKKPHTPLPPRLKSKKWWTLTNFIYSNNLKWGGGWGVGVNIDIYVNQLEVWHNPAFKRPFLVKELVVTPATTHWVIIVAVTFYTLSNLYRQQSHKVGNMFCISLWKFRYLANNTKLVSDRRGIANPSCYARKPIFFYYSIYYISE